ncbi:hypothetical protein R70199_07567 [Paraburkholderia domus]|nr:hypothetical protein R70199_07567 [Paraburkholderia domus]
MDWSNGSVSEQDIPSDYFQAAMRRSTDNERPALALHDASLFLYERERTHQTYRLRQLYENATESQGRSNPGSQSRVQLYASLALQPRDRHSG